MQKYFYTENNIKVPAVTTKQMMEIDRIAMEETGPNLYQMMENAGRNLAITIMEMVAEVIDPSIVILGGTGGNGGGGICAARHLLNRNYNVTLAITDGTKLNDVPKKQFEVYINTGGKIVENLDEIKADIIVDAIIGYSLTDSPKRRAMQFIEWANKQTAKKISLDVPSGIDATSGENYGEYFHTDSTLTLALPKTGLTEEKCGKLLLGDIGIPKVVYEKISIEYRSPFKNRFVVELNYK
ncbi:NAD(P)H-hydrate epimerase [hydrothermal vent metagenome]|uniref:NAD(P)H-hydrate epimerase n=1 Tax=hydrothermal vent metagenome TaxID=652676 RepID=A0A3B1BA32_9ZZZZ